MKPNRKLQQARQNHGFTQVSLAEAINVYCWTLTGSITRVDSLHVSQWETGRIKRPNDLNRRALRSILNATDYDLGY